MGAVGLMETPAIANAADVKLGSDSGQLVFVPDEIKIKVGDSVTWTGNKGLPHNVVFDEENVPDGVDAEALSHADNVGDEGEKVTTKFTKAGTYGYYCEPHGSAASELWWDLQSPPDFAFFGRVSTPLGYRF